MLYIWFKSLLQKASDPNVLLKYLAIQEYEFLKTSLLWKTRASIVQRAGPQHYLFIINRVI